MSICRFCLLTCITSLACAVVAAGENWPRFRGPNGSGVASAVKIPIQFTAKDYNWKIRLPGVGHSSPVTWGERLFITCGDEASGKRILLCVSTEDGRTIWQRSFPGDKHRKHRDNSFASATPTVDERQVYVSWGGAKDHLIIALDHAGKVVWRRDFGPFKGGHGFGASPIVHGDIVVVPNDQNGPSSLIGLDRSTGKTRWTVPRKSKASYSTPCVYQQMGEPAQLIFTNYEHGVTSIDPKSGKVNWEIDVFHKGHVESAIASPVVAGDLVLATCGWMGVRQEVIAIRPPSQKGENKPKRVYDVHRSAPLCITPLVKDDLLFIWDDHGIVTCADVHTGKEHWRKRVNGSYYSSPVCVGDRIYNVSRQGDVVVLAAAKEHKLLGRSKLDDGTHATPAIAMDTMYLKTFQHLISIGGPKAK